MAVISLGVLVVRMKHYHYVGAKRERFIASRSSGFLRTPGFLVYDDVFIPRVCAISTVLSLLASSTSIISSDYISRDLHIGSLKRTFSIVGRENNYHLFTINHTLLPEILALPCRHKELKLQ